MSDDVLTADQLNYVGQPLINLVIDLQHNILNVANGFIETASPDNVNILLSISLFISIPISRYCNK